MAEPPDDLEARVRDLESEVVRIREDVAVSRADSAAARILTGGADRDVSDLRAVLRAHTRSLTALRETQVEQGQEIVALRETQVEQGHEILAIRSDLEGLRGEMRQGFATLHTGMSQITTLLDRLTGPDGG